MGAGSPSASASCCLNQRPTGNAILDALAPCGITHLDLPLTAPRIWHALNP